MTNTRDLILKLREVYSEKGLSYEKIMSLMEQDGEYTSKSTLSRLFGNNWEKYSFDYEKTLIPIANALLDVEIIEENDNVDTKAYKSLLNFIDKNSKRIEELTQQIEEVSRKERNKYQEKLEKETDKFQQELDFAMNQIELKDKRIDQLMDMNHELMTQLLACPCRKEGNIQG